MPAEGDKRRLALDHLRARHDAERDAFNDDLAGDGYRSSGATFGYFTPSISEIARDALVAAAFRAIERDGASNVADRSARKPI